MASDFEEGMLVGILVGEGHFGGDGRQPQVTLRMHERHAPLFRWIDRTLPGGRLYGPYDHGGRRYYQWMARGPFLKDVLLPILERRVIPEIDAYAYDRLMEMKARYVRQLSSGAAPGPPVELGGSVPTGRSTAERPHDRVAERNQADAVDRIFSTLRRPRPGAS